MLSLAESFLWRWRGARSRWQRAEVLRDDLDDRVAVTFELAASNSRDARQRRDCDRAAARATSVRVES
jgi:hypothetical protein